MRIVYVNTKYYVGGAARITQLLHKTISSKNHNSTFFYGRGHSLHDDLEGLKDKNAIRISNKLTILANYAYSRIFGKDKFSSISGLKKLKNAFKKADIIHLNNIHGYVWDPYKILSLIPKNKPVVWTFHDMWPVTGRCAFPFRCKGYTNKCGNCLSTDNYPNSLFDFSENFLKKKMNFFQNKEKLFIVTPSKWMKSEILNSSVGKLIKNRIVVINNSINTDMFKPQTIPKEFFAKYNLDEGKKKVLFIAENLDDPRKGMKFAVDIASKLVEYEFIAIGKKINTNNYVPDNLKQIGYISNQKLLAEFYSLADAYLITSLDDNYPTTVLESLSCGTPVVGFAVGGIPEQIQDGKNGFLVKMGDVVALKSAIKKTIKLGKVESSIPDLNDLVGRYFDLYKRVIGIKS